MTAAESKTMLVELLKKAVDLGVSDIFVIAGFPVAFKLSGAIIPQSDRRLTPEETESLIFGLYELSGARSAEKYRATGDDDFSFSLPGVGRFRVSAYMQRNSYATVIRAVAFNLPDPATLNIPESVMEFASLQKGLVLVTGPAGSGKSTTLSCLIDRMNHTYPYHIITIEDPIEFLYRNDRCVISQREVSHDTESFEKALRYALRQSPNVILVGEMRDLETISIAMTAAETGQLILSTLHTIGAAKSIDRIIDVFPDSRQQQIRVQLAMALQAVISQQLVPAVDGGLIPAFEIMVATPAIRSMIRENKVHQINNAIATGAASGMVTMDNSLISLYKSGRISAETAVEHAVDPDGMRAKLLR
jgi:twitching motility protein PilT